MWMKGEWVYGSMGGRSLRQLGREDTMGQTERRLCLWVFLSLRFQSNIAKSSEPGFGCRDSSYGDGHDIRNLDEMEANKSGSCWGGKFATHQNSGELQFNKRAYHLHESYVSLTFS